MVYANVIDYPQVPGPAGITFRGAWQAGSYDPRSVVIHQNKLWYALRPTSVEPTAAATADWKIFVDPGAAIETRLATVEAFGPRVSALETGKIDKTEIRTLRSFHPIGIGGDANLAFEKAAEWLRGREAAAPSGTIPIAPGHLHLGDGLLVLEQSVNLQNINSMGWGIFGRGAVIHCKAAGKTMFDALGSRWGRFDLNLVGDSVARPARGLQIGRLNDASGELGYPAEGHHVRMQSSGFWSHRPLHNRASESCTYELIGLFNEDASGTSNCFALDGHNVLGIVSDFAADTIPLNTALSSLQHTVLGCDMRMLVSGTPVWISGSSQVRFVGGYVASPDQAGFYLYDASGLGMKNIDLDVHIEQAGSVHSIRFGRAAPGTFKIDGFRYRDHRVHPSDAVFHAEANATTVRLLDADIRIGGFGVTPTNGMFGPAGRFITTGYVASGGLSLANGTLFGTLDASINGFTVDEAAGRAPAAGSSYTTQDQTPVRHSRGTQVIGGSPTLTTKTANYTLIAAESGQSYDNAGATAQVIFTLPPAVKGMRFQFHNLAATGVRLLAGEASDLFRIGAVASSSGGYTETTTVGASVSLEAISANTWIARSATGTWTAA